MQKGCKESIAFALFAFFAAKKGENMSANRSSGDSRIVSFVRFIGSVTVACVVMLALDAGGATIIDDAKKAGKGAMVLAYGGDWSRAGRDVCATYQSDAFKKTALARYVTGLLDVREKPTPDSEKAGKWAAPADLASFRLPALFLVGPNGRGFFAWENIPFDVTPEAMSARIAEAERVRDKAEALVAEAGKLKGEAAAEKIGEALALLEPQLGGTERLLGKKCYGGVFDRLKELDPDDATSWQRRFTMGSGVKLIAEATAARKSGNFAKGEKLIEREKAKPARHLTLSQRQAIEMLPFALYREDESRRAENIKLLDSIASQDSTTLWGMAAVGFMRRYGAPEAAKHLKPQPKRDILRPRGAAAASSGFDYEAVLAKDLRALEGLEADGLARMSQGLGESLVRAYILVSCGREAVDKIRAAEGGDRFLASFFADRAWMESFAGSGLWRHGAAAALGLLDLMAWNEPGVYTNAFLRNAATAFSLNFSPTNPPPEGVAARLPKGTGAPPPMPNDAALVRTLQLFKEFSRTGRLHDSVYGLDVYEWRYLIFPWERNDPEDLAALNAYCNTTMEKTWRLAFKVPYRMFNCFGDLIHRPEYYQPWLHAQSRFITSPEIGGVCGMISSFGVTLCHSHGMMAVTAGQPGHCAFVVRPARGDPRQWLTRYYIQPFTGARFSVLGFGGYQSLLAGEDLYTGTTLAARENARWLAEVRAAEAGEGRFSPAAAALYRRAMESAPGNWPAGDAWRRHLKASCAPQSEWREYADVVLKTAAWRVPVLSNLMKDYFDTLSAPGKEKELDETMARMLLAARLPAAKCSEHPNYAALLGVALNRVGSKSSKRLFGIYSKVLEGLPREEDFFMQAFAWGAKRYFGRPKFEEEYVRLVTGLLEKGAPKGKGGRDDGARQTLRKLVVAAENAALRERVNNVVALMEKLYPTPPNTSTAPAYPAEDFGGGLISSNAFVQVSKSTSMDRPERHQELCDASPKRPVRDGLPVNACGAKGGTWVRLQFAGECEATGIVIVNTPNGKLRAARMPTRVETSLDGVNWRKVAEFDKPEASWRVPLDGSRVRYVRVWKEGEHSDIKIGLQKFLVYGRKLY